MADNVSGLELGGAPAIMEPAISGSTIIFSRRSMMSPGKPSSSRPWLPRCAGRSASPRPMPANTPARRARG